MQPRLAARLKAGSLDAEAVELSTDVCLDIQGYIGSKLLPFSIRLGQWMELTAIPTLPGLAEAVAQGRVGETIEPVITMPNDYPVQALRGQRARFIVKISAARALRIPGEKDPYFFKKLGLGDSIDEAMRSIKAIHLRRTGSQEVISFTLFPIDGLQGVQYGLAMAGAPVLPPFFINYFLEPIALV